MRGQWIGETTDNDGWTLVLDVDEMPAYFRGRALFIPSPEKKKWLPMAFDFTTDRMFEKGPSAATFFDPISWLPTDLETLSKTYRGSDARQAWSKEGSLTTEMRGADLIVKLTGAKSRVIEASLVRSPLGDSSLVEEKKTNWADFKKEIFAQELGVERGILFRGQPGNQPLSTSFHRKGRYVIDTYRTQDVPALHRQLSSRVRHVFDLTNPTEFGAFLSLAQHHGYPTPLLDWSYSPFIAAFFAFRETERSMVTDRVRVFRFDYPGFLLEGWNRIFSSELSAASADLRRALHFTLLEPLAIENPRLMPQQAISLLCTISNIEEHIRFHERRISKSFLTAYDLDFAERETVMRELSYMGITAGSLFPGVDGACEELRERFFR